MSTSLLLVVEGRRVSELAALLAAAAAAVFCEAFSLFLLELQRLRLEQGALLGRD